MASFVSFIKANLWSIGLSCVVPSLIWVVLGGGACLVLFRHARRRGWLEGRLRTILSLLVVLNLSFVVIPSFLACGSAPAAAQRIIALLAEQGTGDPVLDQTIKARLGLAILTPMLEPHLQNGTLGELAPTDTLSGSYDLGSLNEPVTANRIMGGLGTRDLDAYAWHLRRQFGAPRSNVPPRAIVRVLDVVHAAYVSSLDLYPDLLGALKSVGGRPLTEHEAAVQIGSRLLAKHGDTLLSRALGNRQRWWGFWIIVQFTAVLALCSALAWASRPPLRQ